MDSKKKPSLRMRREQLRGNTGLDLDLPGGSHKYFKGSEDERETGTNSAPLMRAEENDLLDTSAPVSPLTTKMNKFNLFNSEEEDDDEPQPKLDSPKRIKSKSKLVSKKRSKLALPSLKMEVVKNIKKFVLDPVPLSLGKLELHMKRIRSSSSKMFGMLGSNHIWELQITDSRVTYDGVAKFSTINDATSAGGSSSSREIPAGPRLVLVAQRKTNGLLSNDLGYLIAMADSSPAGKSKFPKDDKFLVGKLEVADSWGRKFRGFEMGSRLPSHSKTVSRQIEHMNINYECTPDHPRKIRVSLRDPEEVKSDEDAGSLWQHSSPPIQDSLTNHLVIREALTGPQIKFHNRDPVWSPEYETHYLNFGDRCKTPSIENFQIDSFTHIPESIDEPPIVQLGCISPEDTPAVEFNLDVQYPFSVLQAFELALSSIEGKYSGLFSTDA